MAFSNQISLEDDKIFIWKVDSIVTEEYGLQEPVGYESGGRQLVLDAEAYHVDYFTVRNVSLYVEGEGVSTLLYWAANYNCGLYLTVNDGTLVQIRKGQGDTKYTGIRLSRFGIHKLDPSRVLNIRLYLTPPATLTSGAVLDFDLSFNFTRTTELGDS